LLALGFILAITPLQSFLTLSMGWTLPQALVTKSLEAILEIASVPLVISLYFMIYYFLPNGKVPVGRVLPAALATGILTEVGRGIYSLTHPMVRFREVYGPFGVSVTLLFWAYAGALILLFGAHLSAHGFVAKEETGAVPAPAGSEISALEDNT